MNLRGVAQLVARFVRDEEVGGSNPPTPTKCSNESVSLKKLNFFSCGKTAENAV